MFLQDIHPFGGRGRFFDVAKASPQLSVLLPPKCWDSGYAPINLVSSSVLTHLGYMSDTLSIQYSFSRCQGQVSQAVLVHPFRDKYPSAMAPVGLEVEGD